MGIWQKIINIFKLIPTYDEMNNKLCQDIEEKVTDLMLDISHENGCFFVTFAFDDMDITFWHEMKEKLLNLAFEHRSIQLLNLVENKGGNFDSEFTNFGPTCYEILTLGREKQMLELTKIKMADSDMLCDIAISESFEESDLFLVENCTKEKLDKMVEQYSNWHSKDDVPKIELEAIITISNDNVFCWFNPSEGKIEEATAILGLMCSNYNYTMRNSMKLNN